MPIRMHLTDTVYLLPGRGGALHNGLGEGLLLRGLKVAGRETRGEFLRLSLSDQAEVIRRDIEGDFWNASGRVIANSYGAYLFLHAQSAMAPFPGRVLLLSPIVGYVVNEEVKRGFIPAQARKLAEQLRAPNYPAPLNCQIHVGSEDWQADPKAVQALEASLGASVHVVEGRGHMLGRDYVSKVLDAWL